LTEPKIYAVSDLVSEMRLLMERSYPQIWIEGELSSLSQPRSGHWYFSLKDETSQLRCAMFKNRAGVSRYQPKVGDLVRVRAKISVYPARGDLQCIVQHIEDAGLGVLQRRFEELKNKLSQEGLFSAEHKKPIPHPPKHIGLITSVTGAAVKDILTTLARRSPNIPVTIFPAVVQGDGASASLIEALNTAQTHNKCDVLVITRGGGSMEDLWCFNDEALARAVFSCPIPVVSAVGHEVDITIGDLVADVRAPTPTAAAELISPDNKQLMHTLDALGRRLCRATDRKLQHSGQQMDQTFQRLRHPQDRIAQQRKLFSLHQQRLIAASAHQRQQYRTKLSSLNNRLAREAPNERLTQIKGHLIEDWETLTNAMHRKLNAEKISTANLGEQLNLVSPLATLSRGFSIAETPEGQIVRQAKNVKLGSSLQVRLAEGKLACEVTEVFLEK